MVLEIEMGFLVSVAVTVVGAWWGLAVLLIKQFEKRQDERFAGLNESMSEQKKELDSHMSRQDSVMSEIRRVESELARCQLQAAQVYQTKADASSHHQQVITEIRALGTRIDALHGRGAGLASQ